MSELVRYRDDIEWPLNPDGEAKLLEEGVMQSPTIYNRRKHHVNPASLNPFGGSRDRQLREVLDVMMRRWAVMNNVTPPAIPCFTKGKINRYFGVDTPYKGAESVRADDPALHPTRCRQYLHDKGVPLRPIFTPNPKQHFSRGPLPVAAAMDAMPFMVSPTVFAVKYYWGLARPQQIVQRWADGTLDVPDWFSDAMVDLGIKPGDDVSKYFQYRYPDHLDWTAMHAAVASFGYASFTFFDMDDETFDEVMDYQEEVAHDRDTGGVHTWSASHVGMKVGLQSIKVELPKFVRQLGGDHERVRELLEVAEIKAMV